MNNNPQKVEINLNESEQKIFNLINEFRINPKKFLEKKDLVKKKKQKEYENFIDKLDNFPELMLDKELCDISKEELKKFTENENYNKYQIGEEFNSKLSDKFSQKDIGLIAIEELKSIEEIIPKIIINEGDSDKKGRNILINKEYSYIGISQCTSEEDISIILIFAKIKEKIKNESKDQSTFSLSNEENTIFEQIKEFRNNPKQFLDKKDFVKKKKLKEYET